MEMDEYIELTEELILSMRAGAKAIANTKKYHGTIYVSDLFSENPKEMPYLKAAEILYAASEKESADVTPVRHGRWIPVTERLPKLIPCSAGTGHSEAVNVLTSGRKVITAIWDGTDWIGSFRFWDAEREEITHWTPVLLPLPEPPKGVKDNE